MQVFSRGDVAFILGISQAKVKNWTIGRPLRLVPSVRAAKGTGSRNLYHIEDVYSMGLANALSEAGLNLEVVGLVVSRVREGLHSLLAKGKTNIEPSLSYVNEMLVELNRNEITITLTGSRFKKPGLVLKDSYSGSPFVRVRYSIWIGAMVTDIERSIDLLTGRD